MVAFEKPKNKWGWLRMISWAVLAAVVVWMVLVAALKGLGEVSWMAWSRYQDVSLARSLGVAVIPLLSVFVAAWLEAHDLRMEMERFNHQEAERAAAAQRREIIKQLDETIRAALSEVAQGAGAVPEHVRVKIDEIIRASLLQLDGKGKGEILSFLFERGWLNKENPVVELEGLDFSGTAIHKARFNHIHLEAADLRKAKMDEAHLMQSRLSRANLRKAYLRHADLREAVLTRSDLSGTHLEHASLAGADLRGACLEGTFLVNADLQNCILGNWVEDVVQPVAASFKSEQENSLDVLDQAVLIETIIPDGRKVTNEKGKAYLQKKEMAFLIDRL